MGFGIIWNTTNTETKETQIAKPQLKQTDLDYDQQQPSIKLSLCFLPLSHIQHTYRCITLSIILQLTKCKSSFYYYVKYFKRIFQFDDMFAGRSKSTRKCDLMEHVGRGRTTADPERYHHHLREMVVFLS